MRLVCSEYNLDLEIKENKVNVLVIESPDIFSEVIVELINQTGGEPGKFILSDLDNVKIIGKEAEIIVNPFVLDCNEKRILQKLYQELADEMNDSMMEQTVHLQGEMISYLEKLIRKVPYLLDFDIEENMTGLLKMCHVGIDSQAGTLVEKIMSYIRALRDFCRIHLIFFVNLKRYLKQSDLEKLYQFSFYEKIGIILLENSFKEKIENESVCILDRDLCIIKIV